MSSISHQQLKILKNCITRVAKNHKVAAACLYGSRAAGYARANSDFDIIIVLENYGYIIKYVYLKEEQIERLLECGKAGVRAYLQESVSKK